MAWLADNAWIAVVVPMALALVVALAGRRTRWLAPVLASLGPVLVLLVGGVALARVAGTPPHAAPWTSSLVSSGGYEWFGILHVSWTVDSLAAVMLLVVGLVALMVMVFSVGYMADDPGWARYFALLSVFTASMTLLVIAAGFVALFIGWELVGACSYLLVGFWFEKGTARDAAVKAFLTTRVGDVGLLLGIAVLWVYAGGLGYTQVFALLSSIPAGAVSAAAILVAIGAIGKSAQFPLHIWLPDAMEGPTPVSALIHAATMVAAGVFLVVRTWPLFDAAPAARTLLLAVGLISAVGAAAAGIAQTDVKKVLAYSTISQLGFMFVALGVGAWEAAFFHLVAHAAFKALLFLGAGSLIHGAKTQDLREMGDLRREMPITFWTWMAGALALVGIFPFAGFFSKDAIISATWAASPALGAVLIATVAVTAFYVARATRLAFFDTYRGEEHPHESASTMTVPLVVLAIPATLAGIALGASGVLARILSQPAEKTGLALAALSLVAAGVGLAGGWAVARGAEGDEAYETAMGSWWGVLRNAFGWDRLLSVYLVRLVLWLVMLLWALVDRLLIDGIVEGVGWLARSAGRGLASLQTGSFQAYAAAVAAGAVVLAVGYRYPPALLAGLGVVGLAAVVEAVRSR